MAPALVEVEKRVAALRNEVDRFRNHFVRWTTHQRTVCENCTSKHLQALSEARRQMDVVRGEHEAFSARASRVVAADGKLNSDYEEKKRRVVELAKERAQILERVGEMEMTVESRVEAAEERGKEMNLAEERREYERMELRHGLSYFEEYLGLRLDSDSAVRNGEDVSNAKFIFTRIDPSSPKREFCMQILITEVGYELYNCVPRLDDAEELVQMFHETNDLSSFVFNVRRAFKKYVCSH